MKNVTVFLMVQNKMYEFRLGRSIAQLAPFIILYQRRQESIFTRKLLITMIIVVIAKIAILLA